MMSSPGGAPAAVGPPATPYADVPGGRALRVLFISAEPPGPIRRRSYELIRGLRRRGHRVTAACVTEGAAQRRQVEALRDQGIPVLIGETSKVRRARGLAAAAMRGEPFQQRFAWQPALLAQLRDAIRRARGTSDSFDLVHVEHLRAASYGLSLRALLPIVWDSVDCISGLFQQAAMASSTRRGRWMTRLELGRTRRAESRLVRAFDEVVVSSAFDREGLLGLPSRGRGMPSPITVVPNCVDLTAFRPPQADEERAPDSVIVTGKMSYHANETAVLHLLQAVMPLVWRHRPATRLTIAGAAPTGAVRAAGRRAPGAVEITGRVEDLAPHLQRSSVAAAPLVYGAGSQYKVLEAMACATPVVASPLALRSLDASPGRDVLVGDTPEGMAEAILLLLGRPEQARAIGHSGRRYVEVGHDWDGAAAALAAVYGRCVGVPRGGGA